MLKFVFIPMATSLYISFAIIASFYIWKSWRKNKHSRNQTPQEIHTRFDYTHKPVLTEPEQILYYRIRAALPDHLVFVQVSMSQVLQPAGTRDQNAFNAISQKSLDFLVCRRDTSVVAAIELDDSSHNRESRKRADATKDHALQSAGIKVIRWNVTAMPDAATIQNAIIGFSVVTASRTFKP